MADVITKEVHSAVAEASNLLGMKLYNLLSEENRNVLFSPFCISTAFAMLFCGARDKTAEEMREVLGYDAVDIKDDELKLCYKKLFVALDNNEKLYILNSANAVLSSKMFPAKKEYKSLVEHYFAAFFKEIDFLNESAEAIKLVNEWVKEKTNDMIPNALSSLDPTTALIILNAVYFKGSWVTPFDARMTSPEDFYNKGDKNNCKKVDMMHHYSKLFNYAEMDSYQALQLPYKGGDISMLILLPDTENGLDVLENSLDSTFVQDIQKCMSVTILNKVVLPKFKLEYSKSLIKEFKRLGMKRVFQMSADLSGVSDSEELFLTEVNHMALLEVNEIGTEAGAIHFSMMGGGVAPKKQFVVDHPFMFVIYNVESNLILFMGRMNEL